MFSVVLLVSTLPLVYLPLLTIHPHWSVSTGHSETSSVSSYSMHSKLAQQTHAKTERQSGWNHHSDFFSTEISLSSKWGKLHVAQLAVRALQNTLPWHNKFPRSVSQSTSHVKCRYLIFNTPLYQDKSSLKQGMVSLFRSCVTAVTSVSVIFLLPSYFKISLSLSL